jgi:hypothetical protein
MTLSLWLFWALLVFGLVYLTVAASIFHRPRVWLHDRLPGGVKGVIACAPCAAFWVGGALGAVGVCPMPDPGLPLAHTLLLRVVVGGILAHGFIALVQGWTAWPIAELANAEGKSEQS